MRARLRSRFPVDRASLRGDLLAAVLLTLVAVPAGMGYAQVAGLPAGVGLTASVTGLLAYAAVGPSPVYVVGPDSSLAPIIAAALTPIAVVGSDRRVASAALLAIMVGLLLWVGGRLRLGMVADLLAKPIRVGFLDGVALVILAGQLPRLFDLPVDDDAVLPRLRDLVVDLADGQGSATAAWLGGGTIAVWLALRPRFGALALPTAVSALTTVGVLAGAHDRVAVIGAMHGAWGLIDVRELRWSDVLTLLPAAGGIAIVAFADTAALSRSLSDRTGSSSDDGDEMSALGLTNAAVGVLGGFPVSASSTRTPAALAAGASTRICTVVAGVAIATLMLAAPGVTRYVPTSVLSAAIIVAALYLVDVHSLRRWWRVSRGDFLVSCTAFAGVVMLDVLRGIGLAVALAAALFVVRSWRPHCAELVRVDERKGYHDAARHPDGRRIPGLVIARFDAPLFFANARTFSRFVLGLVDAAPSPVQRVIVAAEPITDVDVTAADELADLLDRLAERGITLDLAEAKGPVKDRLRRYGLTVRARAFPTVGTAVRAYLRETGTPWVDWEDRPADQVGAASPEDRSLAPARDRAKRLE